MKILSMRLNGGGLSVLVDRIPHQEELVYHKLAVPQRTVYFAESDGYVDFFVSTRDKSGFGGAVFRPRLEDGTIETVKGPWSSRPGEMNALGFVPSMDVSLTDSPRDFERGYVLLAGHVTVDLVRQALPVYLPQAQLVCQEKWGAPVWRIE